VKIILEVRIYGKKLLGRKIEMSKFSLEKKNHSFFIF